ncbi:MAG: A24 family peptidase [Boseongicola sp.]
MVTAWTTAAWFLPFVVPIAIWVAWSDMATMKIPNKAVIALLVVFVVIGLIALPFTEYLWRYLHFVVVLAICFVLNMVRALGAGDAKFAAAMAPFIARPDWLAFMYLLGATLIAAFVVHRLARASSLRNIVPDWESWTRREFPMGLALAPSLVLYLLIAIIWR